MDVLIMGGTEFVSSSLAKYLISKGYTVDIFTRGKRVVSYSGFRNHYIGDRHSTHDLKNNLKNINYDYVFDISAYTREDVEFLFSVLNTSKLKRYVLCSSGSVYKLSEEVITEEFDKGYNENWGDYGLNKLEAENYVINLYKTKDIPIVIFRPTYIYGKGNNLYRECYIFDRLTNGQDIPIPAGNAKEQFIYIDDLLKVFESAMYEEKAIGEAFNVTNSEILTWHDLLQTSMKITGRNIDIKVIDSNDIKNSREYFPFRNCTYLLDIAKLKEHNLYVPNVSLKEGLQLSYEWSCTNKPKLSDKKMNKVELVLKK